MEYSKLKIGIILVLLIAFFVILNLNAITKEIKNFFYLISSPIQKTLWQAGGKTSDFFVGFFQAENLKKENEQLQLRVKELISENIKLEALSKENEVLRAALGIGLEKEFKLQVSEVIGKDISQDFILIDKGSEDGIEEGFPVITQQKILIGKISDVYKNFSKVLLISNPKSSFDAKLSNAEVFGVVKGKGNFKIALDLIPQEEEIKEGDQVLTSALGGVFPEGLLVGEITEVKKLDVEPFQTATLLPAFDIREIEKLFIITKF